MDKMAAYPVARFRGRAARVVSPGSRGGCPYV